VRTTLIITIALVCGVQIGLSEETKLNHNHSQLFTVSENSAAGTDVGVVKADQTADAKDVRYSLSAGNEQGAFTLDTATGQLKLSESAQIDFETDREYKLQIDVFGRKESPADDEFGSEFAAELKKSGIDLPAREQRLGRIHLTIHVENRNESPRLEDANWSVSEASKAGDVVGRVTANDPDADDQLTFVLNEDNVDLPFTLNQKTGELSLRDGANLDFETAPSWDLNVVVYDAAGATASGTVHIDVTDAPESPVVAAKSFELPPQYSDGSGLGQAEVNDQDANDHWTFAITAGNEDGGFAIDETTGELRVASAAVLKEREERRAELTITATDAAGLTGTAKFSIDLGKPAANSSLTAAIAAMQAEQEKQAKQQPEKTAPAKKTPPQTTKPTETSKVSKTEKRDEQSAQPPVVVAETPAPATPEATTPQAAPATTNNKRAAAAWVVFAVGGGLTLWGGLLVVLTLRQLRTQRWLRQAMRVAQQDEQQVKDRLVELNDVCVELSAERDELLATRKLLTREFDSLKGLLGRQTQELKSTGTTFQHGGELLTKQASAGGGTAVALPPQIGDQLKTVQTEFDHQQQRLNELLETLETRDSELVETCAKMDARLEEVLSRTLNVTSETFDQHEQQTPAEETPNPSNEQPVNMATVEWDERQAEIEALERQFDESAGSQAQSLIDTVPADTVVMETTVSDDEDDLPMFNEDPDDPEYQKRRMARTELHNLREMANHSTRTVLARYSRKKFLKSNITLSLLAVLAFSFASVTFSGLFGTTPAHVNLGWGALATGVIALVALGSLFFVNVKK